MDPFVQGLIITFASLTGAGASYAGFWIIVGKKVAKIDDQESALADVNKECSDLRAALAVHVAAFADYREQALEKFSTIKLAREMEARLREANEASEERLNRAQAASERRLTDTVDRLTQQLDRVFGVALAFQNTPPSRT